MIVYLSAPYTKIANKAWLMEEVMRFGAKWMIDHPGHFVVTPLLAHYMLPESPTLAAKPAQFWDEYSEAVMSRSDILVVYQLPGWDQSNGVKLEIACAAEHRVEIILVSPTPEVFNLLR